MEIASANSIVSEIGPPSRKPDPFEESESLFFNPKSSNDYEEIKENEIQHTAISNDGFTVACITTVGQTVAACKAVLIS
jgi:hypothetical protein